MAISRLLLAAGATLAWLIAAAGSVAEAKEWTKITIATEGDFPPYMKITPDGRKEGLEVDLAADLCKRMKLECTWVVQEKDVVSGLTAGKYDTIMSTMLITTKDKGVVFSVPYTVIRATFAVTKSGLLADLPDTGKRVSLDDAAATKAEVATLAKALKGKVVGVRTDGWENAQLADFFSKAFNDVATVRTYKTSAERDTDLMAGRIDASLAYVTQQLNALSQPGGDALKLAGPVFLNGPLGPGVGVALREGDPELKLKFDAAIKQSIADGTLKTLFLKWFHVDWTPPT
jgi:octopine/nopaline transport system substrate-binding protein